jgi:hypothetical protein
MRSQSRCVTRTLIAGEPRSPDTLLLADPGARRAAVTQVAAATQLLLHGHGYLRLRMAEVGMAWSKVDDVLPDPMGLMEAASDVAPNPGTTTSVRGAWATVTAAHAPITAPTDLAVLGARMNRLRANAWGSLRQPAPSITALLDIATTAISVHRLADHLTHADTTHPQAGSSRLPLSGSARTRAWSAIRAELQPLRTATTPSRIVHQDAEAIHGLLRGVAESARTSSEGQRALAAQVLIWTQFFPQIAGWNAATIDRMSACDQLFIRGRDLVGDDITEVPDLVHAKLTDSLTRAAPSHIARLVGIYGAAAVADSHEGPTPIGLTAEHDQRRSR